MILLLQILLQITKNQIVFILNEIICHCNSTACDVLTGKLGSARPGSNGTDANTRAFKGEVSVTSDGDAIVKIGYWDGGYYSNTTTFGFVTEDGKTPETTCLDLRLLKFGVNFTNPANVTDLAITSSKDATTEYRYYILTFKGSEFKSRLIESESAEYYTYQGNYALQYKLSQTNPWGIQYTHRFSFQLRVKRATSQITDTSFNQISSSSVQNCDKPDDATCNLAAASELLFCKNEACSEFYTTAPTIYLNDNVFMLHRTTTKGLTDYKYSASEIQFVADGLLKKATLDAVVYNPGNATYKFKAPIAWSKLRIQATTTLVSPKSRLLQEGNFRILADATTGEQLQANSDETCVQVDAGSTGCPTCAAICRANQNDAPSVCECSFSAQLMFVSLMMVMLLMF